jgi:hypothetical protein
MRIPLCYNGSMNTQDAASSGLIQLQRAMLFAVCAILGAAGVAGAAEIPATPITTEPTALTIVRDRILVRTWLNGQGPYAFILDTGATAPIIDGQSAATLRLPGVSSTETQRAQAAVAVAAMQVADAPATSQKCITMDLAPFTRILGVPVVGVTGLPVSGAGFTLDVPAGRLSFAEDLTERKNVVPGAVGTGKLTVDIVLGSGKTVTAQIDTSFSGLLGMPEAQALETGLLTPSAPRLEYLPGAAPGSAPSGATLFRADTLSVGAVDIRKPVCALLAADAHPVLGVGFLRLCSVSVAQGGQVSIEARAPMPYTSPPITGYGLGLVSFDGGYWSLAVAKGSPAAQGGAQHLDRLIQINGEPMKDKPFDAVAEKLVAAPKTEIRIVVERGGVRSAMTLKAETLL